MCPFMLSGFINKCSTHPSSLRAHTLTKVFVVLRQKKRPEVSSKQKLKKKS